MPVRKLRVQFRATSVGNPLAFEIIALQANTRVLHRFPMKCSGDPMTGYASQPINGGEDSPAYRKASSPPHARTRASLLPNHSATSPTDFFFLGLDDHCRVGLCSVPAGRLTRGTIVSARHPATIGAIRNIHTSLD